MKSSPVNPEIYTFTKEKAFTDQGTLVFASEAFINIIEKVENKYVYLFPNIMHSTGIMQKLFHGVRSSFAGVIDCDNSECDIKMTKVVMLYIKVRVYASLKRANIASVSSHGKRNRKVLKIMNL